MTAPTPPLTFAARTPDDVLALVPVVLGFTPADSIAMLTFGSGPPFHARVDLPEGADDLTMAVDRLLEPALTHRVGRAVFVLYTDDARLAVRAAERLEDAFEGSGIEVIEMLRADGERWWPALGHRPGVPAWGVPYDVSAHPFCAQAVLEGRVLLGSREELRESLSPDPERVGRALGALADLAETVPSASWVAGFVARHCREGTVATDRELALLMRGLLDGDVRGAVLVAIRRATAREQVAFWTDVVRRCPDPLVPGPAAVLAFAAWQAGHGALAWCALDRCAEVDDAHPLAGLVAQVLERALPPEAWDEHADLP